MSHATGVSEIVVSVVDENLAISLERVPGFGKLGTVSVRMAEGDNELIDVFYSGGFFKRLSSLEKIPSIEHEILLLASLVMPKGRPLRVNYSVSIRKQLTELKESAHVCHV